MKVFASASTGVACAQLDIPTEDTITLTVQWENLTEEGRPNGSQGTAVYTASWIAPKSDVHSQQRFFFMAQVQHTVCCLYLFQYKCGLRRRERFWWTRRTGDTAPLMMSRASARLTRCL